MTNNKTIWKKVAYKTGVWLAAEIWLNVIGLDNIADYSEFIFAQDLNLNFKNRRTVKITEYPPQFCLQIEDFCPISGTAIKAKDIEEEKCTPQVKILQNKCQKLTKPCVKIMCLSVNNYQH